MSDHRQSHVRRLFQFLRQQPKPLLYGLGILGPFLVVAAIPSLIAPHSPLAIMDVPFLPPSRTHLLGTDEIGRDLMSRVIYAARADIFVSLSAALFAFIVGTIIGLFSGYVGGRIDTLTMRVVDVFLSFPTIILALFLIVIFGRSQWVQICAIALVMAPSMSRFSRGTGLVLRKRGYVEASQISGASTVHIVRRHILPNSLPTLLVAASVLSASAILIASSLSYLGLGAQPPNPSWGNMLRASFSFVYQAPIYGVGPGICVTLVASAYVLIGEGLRRKFGKQRSIMGATKSLASL
ncbi:MAG: ABC transporter permease [Ilumatobacteraceae bacterium]